MSAPLLGGRYELLERLATGGQGAVFLARDTSTGHHIAIKCAHSSNAESRADLAAEFSRVASLQHPGIAGAFDYSPGNDQEPPFVVFEQARGRPSSERCGDATTAEKLGWVAGIAETLDFLHQAGLLHGDLKPEHVFVDDAGVPQLIDLGLARPPGSLGGGTPATAAPEVLESGRGDERADLYGLGATLFFWLFGRYPWGDTLDRRLATLGRRPALPAEPPLPGPLHALLRDLLSPGPDDRPPSARAVVAQLADEGVFLPDPALAAPLARAASLPLLGREQALSLLEPGWNGAPGEPRFVAVCGPRGSGRSRLLREVDRHARLAGRRVLALAPGAFGSLRRSLHPVAALRAEADTRPLTALIDDADRWPNAERRVLAELPSRLVEAEDLVVIAAFEEPPDSSGWTVVAVPRLAPESVRALTAMLAPGPPWSAALANRLTDAADGWPGPVVDMVGEAVRKGLLACGPAGWDPAPLETVDIESLGPRGDAAAWPEDPRERTLLTVLAVSRTAADIPILSRVTGMSLAETARAARSLVSGQLAYRDLAGRLRAYHQVRGHLEREGRNLHPHLPEIHESWLAELRRNRPRPGAEPDGPERVEWLAGLAHHAAGCGLPLLASRLAGRAVTAALRLGRPDLGAAALAGLPPREVLPAEARGRLAAAAGEVELASARVGEATALLARAAETLVRSGRTVEAGMARARWARALGDAGRTDEALAHLSDLAEIHLDTGHQARVAIERGIVLARSRRYDVALDAFERAVRKAPPGSLLEARARANLGRCLVLLGRLQDGLRQVQLAREPAVAAGDLGLEAALRLAEAQAALATRDPRRVLDGAARLEPMLIDRGEADGLGMLHALRADALVMIRDPDGALEAARASVRWRELHGHRAWLAASLDRLARVHLLRGELESCRRAARRARELATACGSTSALASARAALSRCLVAEQRFDDAARVASTAVSSARESGDPATFAEARLAQALARRGQGRASAARSAATHALDLVRPLGDGSQAEPEALALIAADLAGSDPAAAIELAERARAEADRAGRLDTGVLALEALAAACAAAGDEARAQRTRHWISSRLHEAASRLGDPASARAFLDRPDRRALVGPRGPDQRRLEVLYQIVRDLNGCKEPSTVVDELIDRALEILQADRGAIVLVTDDGQPHVVRARGVEEQTAADALRLSRTILERAHGGESVLALEPATDVRFKDAVSVRLFAIRAVVCVPLRSKDRRVGAIYVDSTDPARRFGAEDVEFLEALADHAALALENAREFERLAAENERLKADLGRVDRLGPLIGRSAAMQSLYRRIESAAPSAVPVLVQGESGTGKELVARALHRLSRHPEGPFVPVNCAAIPEPIFESILFGHVKGAFTGADSASAGLVARADGGTLFLDEVAELPLSVQAKLLRVLEEGQVLALGASTPRKVSFRLLAATLRDLSAEVREGRFREDLLYRIDVLRVDVPPLRERLEDLPLLIDHLLERLTDSFGPLEASTSLAARLAGWHWPGNVRELQNVLSRLAVRAQDGWIDESILEADPDLAEQFGGPRETPRPASLDHVERNAIERALQLTGGHREKAAALLGIGRATLFRKIRTYGLQNAGRRGRGRGVRPPRPEP